MLHTDASDVQLGGVITQDGRPLAYYSKKLNSTQKRYSTCEKELLSIVEMLKEYKNILFGYNIEINTDHANLIHETLLMTSDRVMRWRLLLEEYNPHFKWIKGEKNIVADGLSRLPMIKDVEDEKILDEVFAMDLDTKFPMTLDKVQEEQQREININK